MKNILTLALVCGLTLCAWGGTTTSTNVTVNGLVPDGNPGGTASSVTLGGLSDAIASVQVNLDITGGYNSDLYAYLVGPQGQFAVLLNRVGLSGSDPFGYGDTGFNITLTDGSANNIHDYQAANYSLDPVTGQLTGTWAPDARNIDPQSAGSVFDGASTSVATLGSFAGTLADGNWTLFIADLSDGGQSTLVSWGLTVVTVPEPQVWQIMGGGLVLLILTRKIRAGQI